jgi:hypothetical protein
VAAPSDRPAVALLRPFAEPMAILHAQQEIAETIKKILKEGTDYGVVPGTDKSRPSLFKAGAERVLFAYDIRPEFTLISEDVDHARVVPWRKKKKVWRNQFKGDREFRWDVEEGESLGVYRYVVRCQLTRRADGLVVGEGLGMASSLESKYVDRPRETENTVLKMAKKRSLVDATLTAFALSDRFTQDVEDQAGARSAEPEPVSPPPAQPAARPKRSPQPEDWTDAEKAAAIELARQLGYDARALRALARGELGHYPPRRGEEAVQVLDRLQAQVDAVSDPAAASVTDTTAPNA